MKRFLLYFFAIFILSLTTACTDKPAILFNHHPITEQNVTDMASVFERGTRIYYLILMPQIQNSRILEIQIVKKGSKDYLGYNLFMSRTIRLKNEQKKYYTDYFVINESGAYIMKVYSKDNPQKVYTQAEFYVK